jgi:predicted transcriptional regulator of viral defense system
MKHVDFYHLIKSGYPILSRADIFKITKDQVSDVQLSGWVKKGLLIKPKNGIFLLKDNQNINPFMLANKLFAPSYVSLETALYYYGLMPDVAATTTCVTTKKTRRFEFNNQIFSYQKIKNSLFFGYQQIRESDWGFLIAVPEKAILDYFYLNFQNLKSKDSWQDLRIDTHAYTHKVKKIKLLSLTKLFNSTKLTKIIKEFDEFLRK